MEEYREICAHNSRIQFIKTNLREMVAMLGSVCSLECLGATAILPPQEDSGRTETLEAGE